MFFSTSLSEASGLWHTAALALHHESTRADVHMNGLGTSAAQALTRESLASQSPEIAKPEILADRKSTRLNSSHQIISYAVFCLKKKKATPRCARQLRKRDVKSLPRPTPRNFRAA